jgi:hypothetical protein
MTTTCYKPSPSAQRSTLRRTMLFRRLVFKEGRPTWHARTVVHHLCKRPVLGHGPVRSTAATSHPHRNPRQKASRIVKHPPHLRLTLTVIHPHVRGQVHVAHQEQGADPTAQLFGISSTQNPRLEYTRRQADRNARAGLRVCCRFEHG